MTKLYIRNLTDSAITIELVRDVCHTHPEWVHEQLGTSSEGELQHCLDQMSLAEFAANPDKTDTAGVYMTAQDAAEFCRETSHLVITPVNGVSFDVYLNDATTDRNYLGRMEYGTLDDDGQYEQNDEEIIAAAREEFGIDDDIPAEVK